MPLKRTSTKRRNSSRRESERSVKRRLKLKLANMTQTHWPHANIFANGMAQERLGKPETYVRERPVQEPAETEQVLKLAGVLSYET